MLAQTMKGRYFPEREVLFKRFHCDVDAVFISDGYVACYAFNEYDDAFMIGFYGKDTIIATRSFNAQQPSELEWVALAGTYVYKVSFDVMNELYDTLPTVEQLARIILADAVEREMKRIIGLRKKAFEVVKDFYEMHPEILKNREMLVFEDIANYLAMASETFRKARTRLLSERERSK